MSSLAGIEDFDVVKESRAGLRLCRERLASQQFALEGGKEALGHGVVIAVADRPHRAADADGPTALAEEQRRLLAAMIGVVNDVTPCSPLPDCHCERSHDYLGAQVIGHRPANDPPTEDI